MDLSMTTSVQRLLAFYAILLFVFYPLCQLADRALGALKRRSSAGKREN